jgi:hypothetical protein
MTKLDLVLARLKDLPPDQQERYAVEIEFMLDHGIGAGSALTDEQWAEVEAGLKSEDGEEIPHAKVVAEMRAKFGE